jgi:hypothetical protein
MSRSKTPQSSQGPEQRSAGHRQAERTEATPCGSTRRLARMSDARSENVWRGGRAPGATGSSTDSLSNAVVMISSRTACRQHQPRHRRHVPSPAGRGERSMLTHGPHGRGPLARVSLGMNAEIYRLRLRIGFVMASVKIMRQHRPAVQSTAHAPRVLHSNRQTAAGVCGAAAGFYLAS